jgi:hypothetical protein
LNVYFDALLLARVSLKITVDTAHRPPPDELLEATSARPYQRIFASYSHADTAVVQRVERCIRVLGHEYLRDTQVLRSGEMWSERLRELIEQAEVFQLFWSRNSMNSSYVRREWEHALCLNRAYFVRPVYWEEPLPRDPGKNLPPPELARLHFFRLDDELLPPRETRAG